MYTGAPLEWSSGNWLRGVELASGTLRMISNLAGAWLVLGDDYRRVSEFAKAIECYEKARLLAPGDVLPSLYIGQILNTTGPPDASIPYLLDALHNQRALMTEHARRSFLLYHTPVLVSNDAFPPMLLSYSADAFDKSNVYDLLASAYYQVGLEDMAARYEKCAKKLADAN
jgi:tetratricopeptide (TPR) repeat protein